MPNKAKPNLKIHFSYVIAQLKSVYCILIPVTSVGAVPESLSPVMK